MAKCPNCGLEAARTIDWVCEWCGYPLPDGSFKTIDKTFRDLKDERLSQQSISEEIEAPPRAKPEPPHEIKPVQVSKPTAEPVIQPKPSIKTEAVSPEVKPAPVAEVKAEPARADIVITVAELLSAYEMDGVAADARFANKILRLSGVTEKINVQDALDIYSLILNSPKKSLLLPGVRCVFDRKSGPALNHLSTGQTVTVQGRYTGSMIDISLRDCFLF